MQAPALYSLLLTLAAAPALAGQAVDYEIDGEPYQGYHAVAQGNPKGSVLIIHDWDGLTDYEIRRADMLAAQGYDAFAADLYGTGNRPVETDAKKAETAKLYADRQAMRERTLAALAQAQRLGASDTVVMGYCFGGAVVLELARAGTAEHIKGYATFHGGLATPEGQAYPADMPPLLVAHGGADAAIGMDQVAALSQELEAAGAPYEIQVYSGAPHAFTVLGSERYDARADRQSWDAFTDLLEEVF
ncbi:dienelactone hydrolase family protein [Halomonas sp. YLGW01]|uniref:dienelactone hydrolase family protein n=1 Tax=Halomonas sp. YLGW01 TaxID=2773308 RepID=UPI00177E204A|nr:dienelactone hydrolase family protein [Halomonas sp. YLGW01]